MTEDCKWNFIKREYEGFPLYLRFPDGLDYDLLQTQYPIRFVVTHTFSFRQFDGLPEPEYNKTLDDFDNRLTGLFDESKEGQIVLVETFGGERNYYFYSTELVEPGKVLTSLTEIFPALKIEVSAVAKDPGWNFIRQYNAEFLRPA